MRRAAKVDRTARELTALARQLGVLVLPLNGVIDALFLIRGHVLIVDFKTPLGKKTPIVKRTVNQTMLQMSGWPIHFISTPEELRALVARPDVAVEQRTGPKHDSRCENDDCPGCY